MGIPERIKEERARLGLTQTAMATLIGATKRSIINWEGGVGSPNAEAMAAMSTAGADVQYILTGVRSTSTLASDEQLLLERYRGSSESLRNAALRVLLGGDVAGPKIVARGGIGQSFEGPVSGGVFKVDMKGK
jgi:transcriptional regulator with XRE-family HTH domain